MKMENTENIPGSPAEKVETREEKLKRAREFSLFDFTYDEKYKEEVTDGVKKQELYREHYAPFNEFIDQAYLRGLELNDRLFIGKIQDVFDRTHQIGVSSLVGWLTAIEPSDPEVKAFFEEHGKQFLNLGGAWTEQYKKWTSTMKE